jgi:DNA polymerase epsilon subunit 4
MYNMQHIFSCFYSFQELFIESLAKEAYRYTAQGKRRTLQKKDIDSAIESADCLAFLEGVLDT